MPFMTPPIFSWTRITPDFALGNKAAYTLWKEEGVVSRYRKFPRRSPRECFETHSPSAGIIAISPRRAEQEEGKINGQGKTNGTERGRQDKRGKKFKLRTGVCVEREGTVGDAEGREVYARHHGGPGGRTAAGKDQRNNGFDAIRRVEATNGARRSHGDELQLAERLHKRFHEDRNPGLGGDEARAIGAHRIEHCHSQILGLDNRAQQCLIAVLQGVDRGAFLGLPRARLLSLRCESLCVHVDGCGPAPARHTRDVVDVCLDIRRRVYGNKVSSK
jgi:hypothetical protein